MNKFEEELMATAKMIPTSDGNEIKFKTSSALYDYLLLSNGEAELYLESQLQQQALPVVKDFVAEWYEGHKDNLDFEIYNFCCDLFKTKSEFATWFGNAENNSISTLIKMKDGYTVEKPQQKRYEVKLLSGESMYFNPIGNPKNIKDYRFSFGNHAGWKTKFTKSELAEIKDGMFLKRIPGGTPLDDLGKDKSYYVWIEDCNYWKNPFIELVPVEDGE
ncbi:DUF1642 domain-containing protein [Lactococcus lactis]|uniref:DUF1642 domain-containing protein n=1 Tax=Lactococcus lactis TaxID=1358 RepID=UPI0022E01415|nr:DUF1642 domain-containing protein [Lactococcus lactis]